MHSFSIISFAALAFAALTSAAPTAQNVPGVPTLDDLINVGPPVSDVQLRSNDPISPILVGANAQLAPVLSELKYITAGNATAAVLSPLLNEVENIVQSAISTVKALGSDPSAFVYDTATLQGIAQLLAGLLLTVFGLLKTILDTVDAVEYDLVFPLLRAVGLIVAELLATVLALVGGLLAVILPLIGDLVQIAVRLDVQYLVVLLHASA